MLYYYSEIEEVWEGEEAERNLSQDFENEYEDSPNFPLQEDKEVKNCLVSWLLLFLLVGVVTLLQIWLGAFLLPFTVYINIGVKKLNL